MMDESITRFIENLKKGINKFESKDLFLEDKDLIKDLENLIIGFLKSKGYRVFEPMIYPFKCKNIEDLIKLFYILFKIKFNNLLVPYINKERDLAIAKAFVETRQAACDISYLEALNQCAQIIHTVFEKFENFKFENTPDFSIFGQKKMGWVTKMAINLLNKEIYMYEDEITDKKVLEILEEIGVADAGWDDVTINEVYNRLNRS